MTPITYASEAEENWGGGENLINSSVEVYVEETEGWSIEPEDQYQPSITYYYVKTINWDDTRTQLVEEWTTFDEPNIEEKEWYNFLWWYSDESCENSYDFESSIENDITLFACWKAKYTVAFDKNYGEEENDEEWRILWSIVTEDWEIIDPERLWYTFLWWSKEESCKNIFDFSEKEIKENFTVYACWEELPSFFVKSFDEDWNVLDTQKIDVGNTAVPYMTTNESWCKAVWQKDWENYDFSTPVTEDIELYAVWDCNAEEDVVEEETSGGVSDDTQSQWWSTSLDTLYDILYNTEPITKEESYAGVTVKVVAPVGSFPSNTELKITPLETVKDIKKVQDALIEQVDDIDETTFMVSFDISFIDPETQEELQPANDKVVEVTFNYEENEALKEIDENEEKELVVYHMDETQKEWEIVAQEVSIIDNTEGEELVVEAVNFSTYTITIKLVTSETAYTEVHQLDNWTANDLELYFLSTNDTVSHYTLMDRNLWASTGYNQNWSSPNSDSYWYVYQWWNNYGFTSTVTSTLAESTTSTIAKTIWEKIYSITILKEYMEYFF